MCCDLIIWYIRLLHFTLVFKTLGPKLLMIRKMLKDLVFFVTIIAIFICSYGITAQASMFPNSKPGINLIRELLDFSYWTIYGDITFKGALTMSLKGCQKDCPTKSGLAFTYVTTIIYMVTANILLINLLIAMFRLVS